MAITKIVDDMRTTVALDATKLSGNLPEISGASLTNITHTPADNSITLAKMAGGTDGQVITYDASGDPVAIGPGTAGQVLTSAGANLPQTFADAGGGAWNFLSTVSATGATNASLDITTGIDNTYKIYKIEITDLIPNADNVNVVLRMGDSSGFDSGASDYSWISVGFYSGASTWTFPSPLADSTDSWIELASGAGNPYLGTDTGEGYNASLTLNRSTTGVFTSIRGTAFYQLYTGEESGSTIFGQRNSGITLDRIQIFVPSGTLDSGSMSLYGLSTS